MNSGGDNEISVRVENGLRALRTFVDALEWPPEKALLQLPEDIRELVRTRWEEARAQPIRPASILTAGGPRSWFRDWNSSTGYYWRRLRYYLLDVRGRSEYEVDSIDDSTDRILAHLEDPRTSGPDEFEVRGLVIGHVQSGKTANFSALITKAADVGYKLVIVLSGVHNELRRQTQLRLGRELGLLPGGVEEPDAGRRWISLTTSDLGGDFHPGTTDANVLQGTNHVLLVVKKNASVLRRLTEWMTKRPPPSSIPVLIIDDEADQASINTGGNRSDSSTLREIVDLNDDDVGADPRDELSPSIINGLIRKLIHSFRRVAYVAYTATPFANVLIQHDATDRKVAADLYPKDFIVALSAGSGYVGTTQLFGRDPLAGEDGPSDGLDVIEHIPESDVHYLVPALASQTPKFEPSVPDSLNQALVDFILAMAARHERGEGGQPACMLIHTTHRTILQNRLAERVEERCASLRRVWRYGGAGHADAALFRERWNGSFRPLIFSMDARSDRTFPQMEKHISEVLREPIPVLKLNSSSGDTLDYETHPGLKAVMIGGNRLSRGLTLEGLVVSYYLRTTLYYDTLLQMGRWFGYRAKFVDLTRLYTTSELAESFRDLALAEEELRTEIRRYERERLTPLDFGPKIRAHPVMLVTARNKMGAGHQVAQSYSGQLLQTVNFKFDDGDWLRNNLDATRRFFSALGSPKADGARYIWANVNVKAVLKFLGEYQSVQAARFESGAIQQYISAQVERQELISWRVGLVSKGAGGARPHDEDLRVSGHKRIRTIERTRLKKFPSSIGILVNPAVKTTPGRGDEEIGLTLEQCRDAASRAHVDDVKYGPLLRSMRNVSEGLLLIYPISPWSGQSADADSIRRPLFDDPSEACTVVGIALVFPTSRSAVTIPYIVGSVASGSEGGSVEPW